MDRDQRTHLLEVLRSAFSRDDLDELVSYDLDQKPELILSEGDLGVRTRSLIAWAEKDGSIDDLVKAVVARRAGNLDVQKFAADYWGSQHGPAQPSTSRLSLRLDRSSGYVIIGGSVAVSARVYNGYDVPAKFAAIVDGIDRRWISVRPPHVDLPAREEDTVELVFSVPIDPDIRAEKRILSIGLACSEGTEAPSPLPFDLTLQKFDPTALVVSISEIRVLGSEANSMGVQNRHSGAIDLTIALSASTDSFEVAADPDHLSIAGGGIATSRLTGRSSRMRRPLFITARPASVTVRLSGPFGSVERTTFLAIQPKVPTWDLLKWTFWILVIVAIGLKLMGAL